MSEIPAQLKDFRNFLWMAWNHLSLPAPTPIQYEIAEWMQKGPRRGVLQGFRGVGKSWICSAFVVHQLLLDPQKNILVVSASKNRADDFSTFTLRLIHEMEILGHLKPTDKQRFSKISFDVGPAQASHAPSVKSLGITSQLTGSRADIIVADDVEVPNNSATQSMRDKLSEQVKEFEAILKPDDDSRILFLGTPQCEDSIYNKMLERDYEMCIWPALKVAAAKSEKVYKGNISPSCIDDDAIGEPTEPTRFSAIDLAEREASYGKSGFAMQFMLDPKLSDLDRYPLKINDLIVMDTDLDTAPEKLIWAQVPENAWDSTVPNVGFTGDRFFRPMKTVGDHVPYTGSVLAIDPSGRGKDETSWAVVKMLNGYLYVTDAGGMQGGYDEKVLKVLTMKAKINKVNAILVESNFGDGMFVEIIKPYLNKIYPVTVEEVRHNIQKEKRIVDTLEPVMNQHKLVFDPKVIKHDYDSAQKYPSDTQLKYQLIFQMSRLTREKGALTHDDRLDALSMGVAYWTQQMAQDADTKINERKNDLLHQQLTDFKDAYYKNHNKQSHTSWI
tara:strand:- start:212 stop:1882 length:1671 start_codon:yes stop_codon:yes gene_type:complete